MEKTPIYRRNAVGKLELICPGCGEALQSVDVEIFPRCPFCDCQLPTDLIFEDFVLDPVVHHWMGKTYPFHG